MFRMTPTGAALALSDRHCSIDQGNSIPVDAIVMYRCDSYTKQDKMFNWLVSVTIGESRSYFSSYRNALTRLNNHVCS